MTKIIVMRVAISKEDIRFTVLEGKKLVWAREIMIQAPNTETYMKVEKEMRIEAWRRAHD